MTKRGGYRPNSGRKTADSAGELQRKQVMLDQDAIDALTALGGGNLSQGIRMASRHLTPQEDSCEPDAE